MFVSPGEKVYQGMILGEHSRESDLEVNPIKEKKLTNIRAAGKDDAMLLIPPRKMSLEQAIAYVEDDEFVEVTPSAIRLIFRGGISSIASSLPAARMLVSFFSLIGLTSRSDFAACSPRNHALVNLLTRRNEHRASLLDVP